MGIIDHYHDTVKQSQKLRHQENKFSGRSLQHKYNPYEI